MNVREVLGSLTFRYIVKFVTVLSAGVFLLLGAFYLYFSYTSFRDLGESVVDELETLRLIYRGQSMAGVEQYIADRGTTPFTYRFHYLVTDATGAKVAGDLPADSRYSEFDDGWLGFELALQQWGEEIAVDFLARPIDLGDGYQALVARNYADIVERGELVFRTLFRVMILTVILGVTAGFFSAANALAGIERLNREISAIVRGDPGRRLDAQAEQGYMRGLVLVVNQMLEQTELLMQGVRRVSDNIAHDLRTPLTRVRNELSQIRAGAEGEAGAALDSVIEECDELLATFNALLRISALESGSRLSGGAEVQLRDLLQDVVELYEPLAQENAIELLLDAAQPGVCRGESDLLFQLFANLLDNAIKYTPRGGRVEVRLQSGTAGGMSGKYSHSIVIADSGPGIPPAERENVFRRFYRVESSRGQHPGHGLGLSLAQAIAHYHRGEVQLGDNRPGLVVRVNLP